MICLSIYFSSLEGPGPSGTGGYRKYILLQGEPKKEKTMEKLDLQGYIKEQREFCASMGAETSTLTMERDDVIVTLKLKFKHI